MDTNEYNSHFIDGFKFNDLIQLRFFDKHLKNVLGNLLDKVEETLRESIIIHTLNSISAISKKKINLPFLLLDDEWSVIISQNIFTNNLSRQSYVNNDGEFNFDDYYSFIAKYLSPFNGDSLFLNDIDLKKFYFYNVYVNHQQLASLNHFRQYKSLSEKTEQLIPIEIEDEKGKNIFCTFRNFFIWCMKNKKVPARFKDDKITIENSAIQGMINALAKSFIPFYKSFTQQSFGDIIKFFAKLNEDIQMEIIKQDFPSFYEKINVLIKDDNNRSLIVVGTFISLMTLFKNLRNKVDHLTIIYNFWDIHNPNNGRLQRNVLALSFEFWLANKPTCDFINKLLIKNNVEFQSNYFKEQFKDKDANYYLDKISKLKVKAYCKNKNAKIFFTDKNETNDIWPLPIYSLKDALDWLLIFTDDIRSSTTILEDLLENNISNQKIRSRMHDYLFNKIIISLKKIDDYNWFIDSNPDDINFTDITEHSN